jgi:serine/threonine protein kinase
MSLDNQNDDVLDCGDYVDSDNEVDIEDEAEPLERYFSNTPYFPAHIGQVLNQRYRIEHKLGYGGFSTVWMAYDIQTRTSVALKITVAGARGEEELRIQNEIRHSARNPSCLVLYQGFFSLNGHQGRHFVLVLPLCGPSLRCRLRQTSMAARMSAAWQLLQALEDLHSHDFVHRGMQPFLSRAYNLDANLLRQI